MADLFLKIRVWTKLTILTLVVAYLAIFTVENMTSDVKVWFFFFGKYSEYTTSVLWLIIVSLLIGIIGTLLFRTVAKTVRQISQLRHRSDIAQLQKDVAKAASLQTRPAGAPADTGTTPPAH